MLIKASGIIKRSFQLYRDNISTYMKYIGLYLLVGVISAIIGALSATGLFMGGMTDDVNLSLLIAVGFVLVSLVIGLLFFWIQITFMRTISDIDKGEKIRGIKKAFGDSKSVFWSSIGVSIMVALYAGWPILLLTILSPFIQGSSAVNIGLGLASLAAMVFAFYYAIKLVFSFYRVVIDNGSIMDSIHYSKKQVSGRWWSILWRLIVPALVFAVIVIVVQILLVLITGVFQSNAMNTLAGLIVGLVQIFVMPLYLTAPIVLYNDLENNSEGKESKEGEDPEDTDVGESGSDKNEKKTKLEESLEQ